MMLKLFTILFVLIFLAKSLEKLSYKFGNLSVVYFIIIVLSLIFLLIALGIAFTILFILI